MGGRFKQTAYVMNATNTDDAKADHVLLTNTASTKAEATNPIAPLSVTIALCITIALRATTVGMTKALQ